MIRCDALEVDEGITALHSQLDSLREWPPAPPSPILSLALTPDSGGPLSGILSPMPTLRATAPPGELNLKPAKPEAWNSSKHNAKPFRNWVLNYLESFAGTAFSKQVVFVLSLTMHTKSQSWTNTHQDWLGNTPARLLHSVTVLLDDFVWKFSDRNAAISTQHWINTTSQGQWSVAQFNNDWLVKVEEVGYMDTLLLVSRYLGHINKTIQEAILALDVMPVGLEATMLATLDREAYLIWKAGLVPVMCSFQGISSNVQNNSFTPPRPSPSTTASTTNMSSRFVTLTLPKISKKVTDLDLIVAMTKPFTSTKGNEALCSKMLANRICLLCRWYKGHATGCPWGTEHTWVTDMTSPTSSMIEEVKEEEGSDFLNRGL